ncbi:MAG: hypothetical protein LLF96_09775 [Eubacteriales bacterium]|nr:hypothetical protein [Eubacteriales bacterium]
MPAKRRWDHERIDGEGKPVYIVGVLAHNSSTGTEMMAKAITATGHYHANTLEAPVYGYEIEPQQSVYRLDSVGKRIDQAREAKLHFIILWFGTSKNGHPNYTPEYIKTAPECYWVASGLDGAPGASLSPHCTATLERDCLAFAQLM